MTDRSGASQGSQLSSPGNVTPAATRSQVDAAHGSPARSSSAVATTPASGISSRAGYAVTDATDWRARWLAVAKVRMSVTSSPQNSTRCGVSPWAGNRSMIPPRTATSPGASTRSVLVYPIAASSSTTPSKSTSTPAASTTGVTRLGLTRWMAARTDATTTVAGSAPASRWRASARAAMVPTLGEMCSKGSVPQAGSRRAPSWNRARSSTRSSASCSPGTTARIGRLVVPCHRRQQQRPERRRNRHPPRDAGQPFPGPESGERR